MQLSSWLLSLAWKPIKHKHLDLFLKFWLCLHPKQVLQPLQGARLGQQLLESLKVFDRGFGADKTSTTHWSGGRVQV